jgi:hypothetical protein
MVGPRARAHDFLEGREQFFAYFRFAPGYLPMIREVANLEVHATFAGSGLSSTILRLSVRPAEPPEDEQHRQR